MAGVMAFAGPAMVPGASPAWAATATLDKPGFDRKTSTINIPFKGNVPSYAIQYTNNATRLYVDFVGSTPKIPTAYKLAVYHELLSQVEMIPDPDKVRLSILTVRCAKVKVDADLRHGLLRLVLEEVDLMEGARLAAAVPAEKPAKPQDASFVVANGPVPKVSSDPAVAVPIPPRVPGQEGPAQPVASAGPLPPNGLDVLAPSPPPYAPNIVMASAPPLRPGGSTPVGYVEPGSPASGQYVYRKAVPTGNQDVTEVQVRTGGKADVDVAHDPRNQSVVVNVVRPDAPAAPARQNDIWTKVPDAPAPADSWRMPIGPRKDVIFRPMPAFDAVVGYALLLNESAPRLGSDFSGNGATTWGVDGHVPLGQAFNLSLGVDGLAYTVNSPQVKDDNGKDAQTRREEFTGRATLEYLAVRSPWVFAIGPTYWARYMINKPGTLLAPPSPSLVLGPNQLMHGPGLAARMYYPIWEGWGVAADGSAAPYLSGGTDTVATTLGSTYGYQGGLSVRWSNRFVTLSAGYRQQGYGSFNGLYTFGRGGPEASFVWRF